MWSFSIIVCAGLFVLLPVASSSGQPADATLGVTPSTFGALGDAQQIPNGCNATAFSRSVTCPSSAFLSGDKGKDIWFAGAGPSGAAFVTTISAVSSSTAITISAAPPTSVTQTRTVYGHDDTAALQSCFNYSAANSVPCWLNTPAGKGYLEGTSGLIMAVNAPSYNGAMNVQGNSQVLGSAIFCEYNGDCLSLQAGPVQGATMANIAIELDPSQPNGRGIHLNAAPAPGSSSNSGGLFNSTFTNVEVDNPALECIWMDGGGGVGYAYNLPNQYITFNNFTCNGPGQMHTHRGKRH
jgi:hypothetical protein